MGEPDADATLVRAANEGDVEAFGELVRRYERRLRLVIARVLDDERDVEEATQDAFVQAWRHLDRYRGDAAVFTWLYRIGVNTALARRRRKRIPVTSIAAIDGDLALESRDPRPDDATERADERDWVARALRRLPQEQREAVVLRDVAGLSNEEVAEALGLTVPAAKSRIHRGRMHLRELLEG
ncbi:MAG: sigma-70 family RNA polymerase sigma factor [Actinobacteria bacterium]|nr:sigma-70 family RNA polymerase sigma factor [Actinomycetota bacterium]